MKAPTPFRTVALLPVLLALSLVLLLPAAAGAREGRTGPALLGSAATARLGDLGSGERLPDMPNALPGASLAGSPSRGAPPDPLRTAAPLLIVAACAAWRLREA